MYETVFSIYCIYSDIFFMFMSFKLLNLPITIFLQIRPEHQENKDSDHDKQQISQPDLSFPQLQDVF